MATWAAPYFVYSRILGLPVAAGGLGHGGRPHVANEYMSIQGLRVFEKFAATFLSLMVEEPTPQKKGFLRLGAQNNTARIG
jgi:hypothetical protein